MKFSCIIVDKDSNQRKILEDYITTLPGIYLCGSFNNLQEAGNFLNNGITDVLFAGADSGIGQLQDPAQTLPEIVYIATDPSSAQMAYDSNAIDCIPRPVSFQRFLKTVDKIHLRLQQISQNTLQTNNTKPPYIFVKTEFNYSRIDFQKIKYVEGLENYARICCEHKNIMVLNTMKNLEAALSCYNFLRIHRSYLVNLDKVDSISSHDCHLGDKTLPIGSSYRKHITDTLKQSYSIPCKSYVPAIK